MIARIPKRTILMIATIVTSLVFIVSIFFIADTIVKTWIPKPFGYIPLFIHDSAEKYFPCRIDFDGDWNPMNNHERYSPTVTPALYYSIIYRENYTVYQFWIYHVYNDFINLHEHDAERIFVFVKDDKPVILAASAHMFWNISRVYDVKDLYVFVERGSHAMSHTRLGFTETGAKYLIICDGRGRRILPDEFELIPIEVAMQREKELVDPHKCFWTNEPGDLVQPWWVFEKGFYEPENILPPEYRKILGIA